MNPGIIRPPTQIATPPQGLLGRPAVVPMPLGFVHPEAQDWAIRATVNGGIVSSTVLTAVSDFCRAIDAAGIRDRFLRLNLFCGGNLSGALVPLYRAASTAANPIGNATDVNVNFVSGDYAETGASAGLKGNGSNKYLQTGFIPSQNVISTNAHSAVYIATPHTVGFNYPNILSAHQGSIAWEIFTQTTSANTPCYFDTASGVVNTASTNVSGLVVGSVINQQDMRIFLNGKQDGATTTATGSQGAMPGIQMYVFGSNLNGSFSNAHNGRASAYSLGYGMTPAQVLEYHTALAAFRLALGRS